MEPTAIQRYANELALLVESDWHQNNLAEAAFPKIAAAALERMPFHAELDAKALFEYGLLYEQKAHQTNPGYSFGDPPLTLCRREHFEVGVLFWLDGTTSIHQHSFSGAFQVLQGTSLHSTYQFSLREEINERLLLGALECVQTELLRKRDIREIAAGSRFIHSLFHLDRPSITLIVRTHSESSHGPQYSYRRPGVALDPFHQSPEKTLRTRLVKSLLSIPDENLLSMVKAVFQKASLEPNLRLLLEIAGLLRERKLKVEGLLEIAIGGRGDLRPLVKELFEDELRVQNITSRRKDIVNEEHRFFLALLLNLPNREAIFTTIADYQSGQSDPAQTLVRWVGELTGIGGENEDKLGLAFDDLKFHVFAGLMFEKEGDDLRQFVLNRLQSQNLPFSEKEFQLAQFVIPELRIFKPLFK